MFRWLNHELHCGLEEVRAIGRKLTSEVARLRVENESLQRKSATLSDRIGYLERQVLPKEADREADAV